MGQAFNRPIEILLVEDNPADARLLQEAFRESRIRNSMSVMPDGVEAMSYLRREGAYANASLPDLILLDLNLPRKNGHEVLAEVKADDELKTIPVVVLTTSAASEDVRTAYNNHANCYITKPLDLNEFLRVVGSVNDFWLSIVKLPNMDSHRAV